MADGLVRSALLRRSQSGASAQTGWDWERGSPVAELPDRWRNTDWLNWLRLAPGTEDAPALVICREVDGLAVAQVVPERVRLVFGLQDLALWQALRLGRGEFWSQVDDVGALIDGHQIQLDALGSPSRARPAQVAAMLDLLLGGNLTGVVQVSADELQVAVDALSRALALVPQSAHGTVAVGISQVWNRGLDLQLVPSLAAAAWAQHDPDRRAFALNWPEAVESHQPSVVASALLEARGDARELDFAGALARVAPADPRDLARWIEEVAVEYGALPLLLPPMREDAPLLAFFDAPRQRAWLFHASRQPGFWDGERGLAAERLREQPGGPPAAVADPVCSWIAAAPFDEAVRRLQTIGIWLVPAEQLAPVVLDVARRSQQARALWDAVVLLQSKGASDDAVAGLVRLALERGAEPPDDLLPLVQQGIADDDGLLHVVEGMVSMPVRLLGAGLAFPRRVADALVRAVTDRGASDEDLLELARAHVGSLDVVEPLLVRYLQDGGDLAEFVDVLAAAAHHAAGVAAPAGGADLSHAFEQRIASERQKMEALDGSVAEADELVIKLNAKCATLQTSLDEKETDRARLDAELADARRKMAIAADKHQRLVDWSADAEADLTTLQVKLDDQTAEVARLVAAAKAQSSSELSGMKGVTRKHEAALAEKNQEIAQLNGEKGALEAKLNLANSQIAELHASQRSSAATEGQTGEVGRQDASPTPDPSPRPTEGLDDGLIVESLEPPVDPMTEAGLTMLPPEGVGSGSPVPPTEDQSSGSQPIDADKSVKDARPSFAARARHGVALYFGFGLEDGTTPAVAAEDTSWQVVNGGEPPGGSAANSDAVAQADRPGGPGPQAPVLPQPSTVSTVQQDLQGTAKKASKGDPKRTAKERPRPGGGAVTMPTAPAPARVDRETYVRRRIAVGVVVALLVILSGFLFRSCVGGGGGSGDQPAPSTSQPVTSSTESTVTSTTDPATVTSTTDPAGATTSTDPVDGSDPSVTNPTNGPLSGIPGMPDLPADGGSGGGDGK